MIPNSFTEYYGDETRWFIGVVKNVKDPLQLGRVQVRIHGIHSELSSDIPDTDLPWAQTVVPVTEGGVSGQGANTGIKEQAQVFGIFLDGKNSQLPLVLGSIPKIGTISKEQRQSTNPPVANTTPSTGSTKLITKLDGVSNIEKAYNYFISPEGGGFEKYQAAGIIGNLMQESLVGGDISPTVVNPNGGATGIAQWNPSPAAGQRLQALKQFAAKNNARWDIVETQCQFINYELQQYGYLGLKNIKAAKTSDAAAEAFCLKFERPGADERHLDKRQKYAKEILRKMET